jgi:ectoine hydroxylase-related dioxygenase (phytanoyl-CoA dioxygenase family)
MIDVQSIVTSIRSQGYAVVPGVLPPDLVATLQQAIDRLRLEDADRFGRDYLYRIGQEGFIINVGDRDPAFERLLLERPVIDVVDAILGPEAFLYLYQGVIVPPGGGLGAYPWKWHCDLYHVLQEVKDVSFIPGVNCLFYLDDVDTHNGGTWILPGTHGLTDEDVPWRDAAYLDSVAFQVEAPAGSVALFNPLLWHCAGANYTGAPRRAVKMLMARDWMLPQMDYSRSIRPEVLNRLDNEALRILGHRSRVPRSFEEITV